jgi:hypothetical protein
MDALFTILVIALALFSVVAVMVIILREKVDHDAHLKYVRSPWTEEATEAQEAVDAHFQKSDAGEAQPRVTSPYADEQPKS